MGIDIISRLLFPTPPSSYTVDSYPEELIWVPKTLDPKTSSPEDCVPCLFLSYSSARFLIFYLHSNAEDIGRCHAFCSSIRAQFQVHVLAVEYPGYGICPGGPCDEQRVTENAFVAFRFVREVLCWPLDSILILGRSIGCGPAISLAVRYQVSGVIVVSPMLSVKEVCKDAVGPLAHLFEERFPNKDRVPLIRSPFLVVHGQKDMMIPCRHGVELYGVCRSRKLLVCPKEMEHNTNLLANVTYFVLPMLQFFSLPDYCFEDIQVPSWAYDKRLSPYFIEPQRSGASLHQPAMKFGSGTLGEDTCDTPTQPTMGCFTCPSMGKKGEQDPMSSIMEKLFGRKVVPTPPTAKPSPVRYPWAVSAPAATSPMTQSRRVADTIVMNSPSPSETSRACSASERPVVKALEGALAGNGRPAARVVAPPRAARATPTSPPFSDPKKQQIMPNYSPQGVAQHMDTRDVSGRPDVSGPQHSQHMTSPSTTADRSREVTADSNRSAPLVSPPKSRRELVENSAVVEEAIAGSRKSNGSSHILDMQEPTASRNRFQESANFETPPWSPASARQPQHRELRDNTSTAVLPSSSSPRPPSPSERLKLLTPIDLVEIVTDLERHFAKEPPGSTPRQPAANNSGSMPKAEKAESPEKAEKPEVKVKVVPPSPMPIPPRSPILFGRVSERLRGQ